MYAAELYVLDLDSGRDAYLKIVPSHLPLSIVMSADPFILPKLLRDKFPNILSRQIFLVLHFFPFSKSFISRSHVARGMTGADSKLKIGIVANS